MLLLAVPHAASAQEITVVGVVVRLDADRGTFWMREGGPGGSGRIWVIRAAGASRPSLYGAFRLRVGDVVEVRGWLAGANHLAARIISVRGAGDYGLIPPRGRDVEIEGTITAIDLHRQRILQIQDRARGFGPRVWTVRLTPRTRVAGGRGGHRWDDDRWDGDRWDDNRWDDNDRWRDDRLRWLRIGYLVRIEGRLIGDRQILAEEITLLGQARFLPRPVSPPVLSPAPPDARQIIILRPQQGEQVSGVEFAVVGRTVPGARVQILVTARWAFGQTPVAQGNVATDQRGEFAFVVRPSIGTPGTIYTITATPILRGSSLPPATVTVRAI